MARHLSFWIGFFAAALVIVPVAVGAWGVTQGFARDWAAVVFSAVCTVVAVLVLGLLFRGTILRRLTGRAEATVEDISGALISGVSAAVAQDRAAAEQAADRLARVALGWYAWSNFYRWVIGTALALLLAFASFTGTVLLFEQIAKLGEQTEVMEEQTKAMRAQQVLMEAQTKFMESQTARLREQTQAAAMQNEIGMLSLVSQLRQQILNTAETISLRDAFLRNGILADDRPVLLDPAGQCGLGLNLDYPQKGPASGGTLAAIEALATEGMLAGQVRDALSYLLEDTNGAVALSALLVLDRLGADEDVDIVHMRGTYLKDIALSRQHSINVTGSYLSGFSCPLCRVTLIGTFNENVEVASNLSTGSVAPLSESRNSSDRQAGILLANEGERYHQEANAYLHVGGFLARRYSVAYLWVESGQANICSGLQNYPSLNPLFVYMDAVEQPDVFKR